MEKIYVVHWGCGSADARGRGHAYSGVVSAHFNKADALKALEEYKDETLEDVKNDIDPDGDMPELVDDAGIQVYGSVAEEYFEIDYELGLESVEIHIGISETTIA